MEDTLIINVEEIGVKGGLNDSSEHGDRFRILAVGPAINPIEEVKGAVEAQTEEIMRGDGFGFTGLL